MRQILPSISLISVSNNLTTDSPAPILKRTYQRGNSIFAITIYPKWFKQSMTVILVLIALIVGSFLSTVAIRLPLGRPITLGRSECDRCGHKLGLIELIPFLSWCFLRGRCLHCGAPIAAAHPLAELGALAVAGWATAAFQGPALVATCILGWLLLALALVDWRAHLLPDALTGPLLIAGFLVTWLTAPDALVDHAIAAIVGFAVFVIISVLYKKLRGREGLGFGDAKLLAAIGAWVSWQGLPTVVLLGAASGLCFALLQSLAGKKLELATRLPFGCFLALGGWLVWLYGPLVTG
jgi:leader peptidase (prepilin peptidase)/N-methyltransferase